MTDLVDIIKDLLAAGEDVVVARVVSVKGSSPRDVGASMVVRKGGETYGTIGGGLIEAAAIQKSRELFKSKGFLTLAFDMTSDDIKVADMVCGGKTEVVLEFLPSSREIEGIFGEIKANLRDGETSFLVTGIPAENGPASSVQHQLLKESDLKAAMGHDGHSGLPAGLREELSSLVKPTLVEMGAERFWIDIIRDNGVVYIFGAGHVGLEVSNLALRCGFRTVALDDRAEFANEYRFKKPAETIVLKSFLMSFDGLRMNDSSYIVILTRGHKYDKVVLEQALRTKAGYIGMIGSTRKRDTIYKALVEEGFSAARLEKVHCPIGIKMEAETPAEIAVSIVAELINVRAEKRKWAKVKLSP